MASSRSCKRHLTSCDIQSATPKTTKYRRLQNKQIPIADKHRHASKHMEKTDNYQEDNEWQEWEQQGRVGQERGPDMRVIRRILEEVEEKGQRGGDEDEEEGDQEEEARKGMGQTKKNGKEIDQEERNCEEMSQEERDGEEMRQEKTEGEKQSQERREREERSQEEAEERNCEKREIEEMRQEETEGEEMRQEETEEKERIQVERELSGGIMPENQHLNSLKMQHRDDPVYPGAPLTKGQSLLLLMSYVLRHNLTGVALQHLLNIFNEHFPGLMPATLYLFDKAY
ncbi:hypothetical protein NFI96_009343, partial [Prochilodus magdalenae]